VIAAARLLLLIMLTCGLGACRPRTTAEDLQLAKEALPCPFAPIEAPMPEAAQSALFATGRVLGAVRARAPAERYTQRLTEDGYWLRGSSSTLVMSLAGLGLGGLGAALLLVFAIRRPAPRWAERLGQSIARAIEQLRTLGSSGDALAEALVGRFDEPLAAARDTAQRLVARAIPLARRTDSTTAQAHLESLEHQLEGLLARIERIHLQILVWNERQSSELDEAVKAQVATAIAELESALAEVR